MNSPLHSFLQDQGLSDGAINIVAPALSFILILVAAYLSLWVVRRFVNPVLEKLSTKTRVRWDDVFVERKFFFYLSRLVPIVIVYAGSDVFFAERSLLSEIVRRAAMTLFVLAGVKCLDVILQIAKDIYNTREVAKERPIAGYLSFIKIVLYIFAGIFIVAILTDKSPWGILSVLGGLTAVLILVFKDTILGFVASLQLSGNQMVRVGDWIEMPKFHADGDVIDVSIHTVKVQNWDKTISTIPTYALVANSFKNWRGMNESGGRRIKRAVHIDMNSIQFCTDEMQQKFAGFDLIKDYLKEKTQEIDEHNRQLGIDISSVPNGRRQTNIGVFRSYIQAYLHNNPKIHQDMTFLVRHLAPTAKGLPIEIYVFSNDQAWANYEAIQADIFDHILAVLPEFGLRVFQEPCGADFLALGK